MGKILVSIVLSMIFLSFLWGISEILFPFLIGLALAYFLDPLVDSMERVGFPRWMAAAILTFGAAFAFLAILIFLVPILIQQFTGLLEQLPVYRERLEVRLQDFRSVINAVFPTLEQEQIAEKVRNLYGPEFINFIGQLTQKFWNSGVTIINVVSLLVVTPIIVFYLLRDWDHIVRVLDTYLPRDKADVIRRIFSEIDVVLSGFVRGQFTVCLLLGIYYALCLALLGLNFGLVIGLISGLISFVPYFGMLLGLSIAVTMAVIQFGAGFPVLVILAIFILAQVVEGNFVTPKLVGEKVGLHPAWMIFSLMSGGALFGLNGIIIAVPVAAVLGVVIRFFLTSYLAANTGAKK
jgi:predicted PurR-regulated permease PerM